MKTPIYDYLKNYAESSTLRLHMPGHKGRSIAPELDFLFSFDITEIFGADSLFEASGIIRESEKNASHLFGTKGTFYSAGGSTLCIQAMLAMMKAEGRTVIAVRNVHRAFFSVCVLLGIEPEWVYPHYSGGILSGEIPLDKVKEKLKKTPNACLYITSPDYLGKRADIKTLAGLCHKYGAVLVVDNAHGAHLCGTGEHPIALGADLCCDSAHKMLPALTGSAYLHTACERYCTKAKQAMAMFGSTSPSYLILASLDLCNRYIAESLESDTQRCLAEIVSLKAALYSKYEIYDGEPFHLTLLCDGDDLSAQLREKGIECEYSDSGCVVLLLSPVMTADEIRRVGKILLSCSPLPSKDMGEFRFPEMERKMTVRDAALSTYEAIAVENAEGRVCGPVNVPCPPAVPIAVSGEVINEECIKIFKKYGILTVNVVK